MNRFIFLLRGVTPTGRGRVPMAAWREAMAEAGFVNTRTWIQSGNALADTQLDRAAAMEQTRGVLLDRIGADLAVIVKTAGEITRALDNNPFSGLPGERVFYGLFNEAPDKDKAEALAQMDFGEDRLHIGPYAVYCFIPGSAARTKLTNAWLQKKLGIALTFRNANTLNKLVEMAGESQDQP